MYTDILQSLGLPKNEAKIYESLLKIGPANASAISSNAKVNRRNVYDALNNLSKRGLIIWQQATGEKRYQAEPPSKLQAILDAQKQKIQAILPELKGLYKEHTPLEQASVGRGTEAIINLWRYFADQRNTTIYFGGGKGAWHDPAIDEVRREFAKKYKERGTIIKGIFDYEVSEWGEDIYSQYDEDKIRFFPKDYSSKGSFDICNDLVALFPTHKKRSVEGSTVFTIISESLAKSYITWFEFLWKQAKPLSELK